jgi:ABC-type transport system substrate-binding protein
VKKLLFIPLVIILLAGMSLGVCSCEKGPEPGSVLRVSMPTFAYETFDFIQGESFFGWSLYDPIITWDENLDFVPAIAESWEISDDGLTWTFHIRDDVTFHNGDPLTSADVMFSVEHFQSPESTNPWTYYLNYNYDSQWCPDDYTYCYKTVEPEPPLVMLFASTRVLPKNYIEENGIEYFREHPIGSGPWKFVSFTSGQECVMEANTEHWRTVPHFEQLIQYVVPEEATQVAMLKRGEVDIITGITLDRAMELKEEGWRLQQSAVPTGCNVIMPGTWMTDGPTSDIKVRRALAAAINYEELCETFFHGFAEPGGRFFHYPGMYGWDDDWGPEVYDLALVQDLLDQAGYPDAFADPVIHIYVQTGTSYTAELFQILQSYWTAAGIQTDITMVDAFEMLGMFFVPHYDDPTAASVGAILPWVYGNSWPTNVYHSKNMYCPAGMHTTSNDDHALELYMKAVTEIDPDLAEQYYTEFSAYVHDELFINFGICLVWDQMAVGPEVGEFGWAKWMTIWDAYADISHS